MPVPEKEDKGGIWGCNPHRIWGLESPRLGQEPYVEQDSHIIVDLGIGPICLWNPTVS